MPSDIICLVLLTEDMGGSSHISRSTLRGCGGKKVDTSIVVNKSILNFDAFYLAK